MPKMPYCDFIFNWLECAFSFTCFSVEVRTRLWFVARNGKKRGIDHRELYRLCSGIYTFLSAFQYGAVEYLAEFCDSKDKNHSRHCRYYKHYSITGITLFLLLWKPHQVHSGWLSIICVEQTVWIKKRYFITISYFKSLNMEKLELSYIAGRIIWWWNSLENSLAGP